MPADPPDNVIPFPGRRTDDAAAFGADDAPQYEPSSTVTVVLGELRGWTVVSEQMGREDAERGLSLSVEALLGALGESNAEDLTLEGDATQPGFSCGFEGNDGAIRALRAAQRGRRAVEDAQEALPAEKRFRVSIGVSTGEVRSATTVGDDPVSFRSVGAIKMFAARLRDFAGAGQIFLSADTYEEAKSAAVVTPLGDVRVNAYGDTRTAYSLTELQEPPG